uniref:Uncharacterized protein n=1 Tax=Rhipicephalus microplus TaxID=6941 RepID=A0A6G5AIS5_RHIMP
MFEHLCTKSEIAQETQFSCSAPFLHVQGRLLRWLQAESALTFLSCNFCAHVPFMVLMTISLTSVYSFLSNSSHTSSDKFGCFLNSSKSNWENGGKVTALSIKSVMRHSRTSCFLGWPLRVFTIVELSNAGLRWS